MTTPEPRTSQAIEHAEQLYGFRFTEPERLWLTTSTELLSPYERQWRFILQAGLTTCQCPACGYLLCQRSAAGGPLTTTPATVRHDDDYHCPNCHAGLTWHLGLFGGAQWFTLNALNEAGARRAAGREPETLETLARKMFPAEYAAITDDQPLAPEKVRTVEIKLTRMNGCPGAEPSRMHPILNRACAPVRGAGRRDYPLTGTCAHCDYLIGCADFTADWYHVRAADLAAAAIDAATPAGQPAVPLTDNEIRGIERVTGERYARSTGKWYPGCICEGREGHTNPACYWYARGFTAGQPVEFRDRSRSAEWEPGTFARYDPESDGRMAIITTAGGGTCRTEVSRVRVPEGGAR
jgi:hypothetical protein